MGMVVAIPTILPPVVETRLQSKAEQNPQRGPCLREPRKLCLINLRRWISIRSNARAAKDDCWAITTAPIRRVMMPGPGTKRRKTPDAASKMPPAINSALRTAPLLNRCRWRNCCWKRRPGKPALKRRQLCFRCFNMDDPRFTSRLLKKTHMLRCAQSPRINVLSKYASARRFFACLASEVFLSSLESEFFSKLPRRSNLALGDR
jgi:hypothetical protein